MTLILIFRLELRGKRGGSKWCRWWRNGCNLGDLCK